ncbi:MAG: hypothetical protein HOP95_08900 [Sphingomonas sp.]|nr:hypothetical protein [Sphingomonas sp.]
MNSDWTFWFALVGAALVRVLTSPFHSLLRAAIQISVSVFIAWLFTDAAVDYLHLNPSVYRAPMGGLLALTADGLVRIVLNWAASPRSFLSLLLRRNKDEGEE